MEQQESCQGCGQRQRCQSIYQKMGNAQGPSVVRGVILAFVLPIVIFIMGLAISRKVLETIIVGPRIQTSINVVFALLAVFVYLVITKRARKKPGMNI